eukprot:487652-Amphidinium_carterae.1
MVDFLAPVAEPLAASSQAEPRGEIKWVYGPATCVRVPMEQMDSVRLTCGQHKLGNESPHYRSVMELILEQRCGKIAAHPIIAELQDKKWKQCCS